MAVSVRLPEVPPTVVGRAGPPRGLPPRLSAARGGPAETSDDFGAAGPASATRGAPVIVGLPPVAAGPTDGEDVHRRRLGVWLFRVLHATGFPRASAASV